MLQGLQELEIGEETPDVSRLESDQVGMIEAVMSPHTTLAGKTLREVHFREKYGLSVLAIYRSDRVYRTNLRDLPLEFGDALLLYGRRERLAVLGSEPDFLVLTEHVQEAPRIKKAPWAVLILVGIVAVTILNLLPISIAAVLGAALWACSSGG